jgi:CHAT domain-containing protein
LVAGIVQEACACALQAGDPRRALTLLEHGRGILFAQALENRDDVSALHELHPDLADRFERIRADLPGAMAESELLRIRLPRAPTVLGVPEARRGRVLAELPRHNWVHFACHGHTDAADPSASYLLLPDHRREPLTVLDISRLRLERADLAYLSACSTARVGTKLTDEAIHLASAFHLAGYRQVIATSWPITDRPAVRFATEVYGTIMAQGTASAALAVHAATRRLRQRYPDNPRVWAAHIHIGA